MPRAKTPRNGSSSKRATSATTAVSAPNGNGHTTPSVTEEQIRLRAYELYEQRGCIPGREHEDWLLAEQEIAARHQQPGA